MLLSVSMILHLPVLFMCFIASSYSELSTINKVCGIGGSTCGVGQVCVNNKCECNPEQRQFWAGEKLKCRVCPATYIRRPTRCYRFYKTPKTNSAARADCIKDQADLFSWRDNTDENELIVALTSQLVGIETWAWLGGMIYQGRGTKAEYKITWFDPEGPAMRHPDFKDPYVDRFCSQILVSNYAHDAEPTRRTKNGETENCVTFVFVPQPNSPGIICMADDFCSQPLSYICELTAATIANIFPTAPPLNAVLNNSGEQPSNAMGSSNSYNVNQELTQMPAALAGNESSNTLIYVIGFILILVIAGVVAFIIIRKRKKNTQNTQVSPTASMASSNMSDAEMYGNA